MQAINAQLNPVEKELNDLRRDWAEQSLLDLVEHLLDWVHDAPILVLALARPELLDARPAWAGGQRQVSSIRLEALSVTDARNPVPSPITIAGSD